MIVSETVLRSRIRSLLLEMQVRPLKLLIKDIEFHSNITDEEFSSIEKRLRSKWDRGYSKYSQVIKNDVMNNEPVDHILDAIDRFMPYYSRVGPQMQAEIGRGDLTSSDLRGYVESQASDKLNKTRTSQREICRRQVPIREGEECKDFKVIHADSEWTVVYPKTMLGSMSWAVGLADGSEEKYEVSSVGKQIGRVGWCTASYENNRFLMYAGNMHMYYFVKNSGYDISDRYRRLCVTWSKNENTEEVQIQHKGNATVDAYNKYLSEEKMLSLIGQELVEKMRADASSRKATSLAEMASKVTLPMVKQDIENLKDDPELLKQQLEIYAQHAKDSKVIEFFVSHEDEDIRYNITGNKYISEDAIRQLAQDEEYSIRSNIAGRKDLPEDVIRQLSKDESNDVRDYIALQSNLPEDLVRQFVQDKSESVRGYIAGRKDLPEDLVRQLALDKSEFVRYKISSNSNLPEDLVRQFAQDKSPTVRFYISERNDLPEDVIRRLAQDKSASVRGNIALCSNLPEGVIRRLAQDEDTFTRVNITERNDLPEDLIMQLAQDEERPVRRNIARRSDLPKDAIRQLAKDKDLHIRITIAERNDLPKDVTRQLAQDKYSIVRDALGQSIDSDLSEFVEESRLLRNYINMLMS